MSAVLPAGRTWSPAWGPQPRQPYATLACGPRQALRWDRRSQRHGYDSQAADRRQRRAETGAGRERLRREIALVVGSVVAAPPMWVLEAWVDHQFIATGTSWAPALDAAMATAEAQGRPLEVEDLWELQHLGRARYWMADHARRMVMPAQAWAGPARTAWHEAGHALMAWHHQDRYTPYLVDLTMHLGGLNDGALFMSPAAVPTRRARGGSAAPLAQVDPAAERAAERVVAARVREHQVWLSGGMAAEQTFAPHLVPTGDAPPYGRQYVAECNVLHLEEAMILIGAHREQVAALGEHLLAHSGASTRHLTALLGPRQESIAGAKAAGAA